MSKVHVSLHRDDGTSERTPICGAMRFAPTKRRTAGADVILPAGFDAALVDGEVTVELAPTGPGWCWTVYEPTLRGVNRHILVPDVSDEVLEYALLPDVDPVTLEPSAEPEAAWWAIVESLPLPSFRPDPDRPDIALLVDVWTWQLAADNPNLLLVSVEV